MDHLAIPVSDQERSRRFYETYFGFGARPPRRYDDGVLMLYDAGGFALALGPSTEPIARPSWMHFGLGLPDRDAVRALRDRLRADGVELVGEWDEPDYVSVKCRDPDGYIVEASWGTGLTRMRAIVQETYGEAEVLQLRDDVDRPVPRDDDVLIRVHAAGVGPDVWHLMAGVPYMVRLAMGLRGPRNPIPGWDAAGRVEAVGSEVTGFSPGDEVFGSATGAFAEYARAKADKLAPKPAALSFAQAAAVPVAGVTALQALRDKGRLQPGQDVLVIGASGGVGTFAVQLATAFGARVTGVCGPAGADLVRSLGAHDVIDYTREAITDRDRRYDLIVDGAGNRPLATLRRVLGPRGTLVIVGGEAGGRVTGMARQLRAHALSPFLRQRLGTFVAVTRATDLLEIGALIEQGRVEPVVDRTYPLEEAAAAVRHLRDGHPRGKVVLTI